MSEKIRELEASLSTVTDPREKIDLLNELAWNLGHSDPQRNRVLGEQARQLATTGEFEAAPYTKGLAFSLLILSIVEWNLSNYQAALSLALEALSLFQTTDDLTKWAYTLNHIAGIHFFLGNYPQALELGLEAIRMSEEIGDRSLQANLLNDTGYIWLHLERFPDALPQLFKSLQLHREVGSRQGEAQALDSISKAYYLMGEYTQALTYALHSLECARSIGYQRGETETLGNLGRIHAASGDDVQALGCFKQSLVLARQGGYKQFEAAALLEIGRVCVRQGDTERARSHLSQALAVAQEIQAKQVIYEAHQELAEAHVQMGRFEEALAHYQQFHTVKDEVFNERSDNRLRSLQVMHQVETAKQEAEIYQLRNVALQQEINEREKLIAELNAFAHTVAHDLKNPLSVILGYSDLLLYQLRKEGDNNLVSLAENLLLMSEKSIRIVDELLTLASVRQEDITPLRLDMAEIVGEAERRLVKLVAEYDAQVIKPPVWPQALGYAPWVEEVWANYVSNAIQYGGRPPRIELGATPENGVIRFWVRDNGAGVPPEVQAKLFTEFTRLDIARVGSHGLGLSIVKRIVEKLGGTVSVESSDMPDQGSLFSFTLPAAPQGLTRE